MSINCYFIIYLSINKLIRFLLQINDSTQHIVTLFSMTMLSCVLLFASTCVVALATNEQGRIYGGSAVSIEDYPHQVSIFKSFLLGYRHDCGGSILSDRHILTAAHCIVTDKPGRLLVFAGLNHTDDAFSNWQPSEVVKISVYPKYEESRTGIRNDIAMLEIFPPLKLGVTRHPIKVGHFEPKDGDLLTVTGYGRTEHFAMSGQLLGVTVPTVSRERCNRSYRRAGYSIGDESFCAGYEVGDKDACQGDSGGPVILNGELVGIVSWGYGCARPKMYGVYTNVVKYLRWIQEKMSNREDPNYIISQRCKKLLGNLFFCV